MFRQLQIEEYQAKMNQNEGNMMEIWEPVYDELYNI